MPLDLSSVPLDGLLLPLSVGRLFSTISFLREPQTPLPFLLAVNDLNSFTENLEEASELLGISPPPTPSVSWCRVCALV